MNSFKSNKVVKFLASLKLAVIVILSLVILMTWGTLTESYHNATFAKWKVYFSPLFLITEVLLFLNILFAALVRLPVKGRLSGFYITHLGLLLLMVGAALTGIYGIDGSLRLLPETKTNTVVINEPTFYAFYTPNVTTEPLEFIAPLPRTASPVDNSGKIFAELLDYQVTINKFYPFATPKFSWIKDDKRSQHLTIALKNKFAEQTVNLSTKDQKQRTQKMGPLSLRVFKTLESSCFLQARNSKAQYVFQLNNICIPITNLDFKPFKSAGYVISSIQKGPFKKIELKQENSEEILSFYPKLSESPVSNDVQVIEDSNASLVPLKLFEDDSPFVLIFADKFMGFGKGTDFRVNPYEINNPIELPWMGMQATVTKRVINKKQKTTWFFDPPRGSEDQRHFAANITLTNRFDKTDTHNLWIDDLDVTRLKTKTGMHFEFLAGRKLIKLPFYLSLQRFKMQTNPGTMDPASYESFVTVNKTDGSQVDAHVFMNNPLKEDKYTLYQSSYFQLEDGKSFGSVLSVNYDPGRFLKYLGSFLIVFGSTLHFIIRNRKTKRQKSSSTTSSSSDLDSSKVA